MDSPGWSLHSPHPALRGIAARYIGYRQHDGVPEIHRGLPSRHVTLVVALDEPVRIVDMPGDQSPAALYGLVGGLHTAPALMAQGRAQTGVQVDLNPLGVRRLLGVAAYELAGQVVDLADLGLGELPERLAGAPTWAERFAILDDVLLTAARGEHEPPPEVGHAWRSMLAGTGRVDALAREVGWSRRHLSERFRREVGLTPKQAARVLRFERACETLRRTPGADLAELAVTSGFYDQAHLTNEWRALAGCTPGTWIGEELPNLQYGDTRPPRDSVA
ncbi:AraC family transcriptional regulator [Herbihabitans rhizosphaerae]|uniref:AraC family transcriptional regulator n=1 Tax=Herbihabitans rhizosphaerae TaxID=1872711 RepID=A0A4Q7KHG6_9PSEU|nr:helix-turn-helix domain-containing protein [Herbihabitans rhizosphaerae]RZS34712.1 AraC family transcriptional regulator [Herbihabitans rhizosphaerae]